MSKRSIPNVLEIRMLLNLVGECRELGDDPLTWRRHFYERIALLTDADVAMGGESRSDTLPNGAPARMTILGSTDSGWPSHSEEQAWQCHIREVQRNPNYSPLMNVYLEQTARTGFDVKTREELIRDPEWYRHPYFANFHQPLGLDAALMCLFPVPGRDSISAVFMGRAPGRQNFSTLEKTIVREAHQAVACLLGGALTTFDTPSPSQLGRRAGEVLELLLDGATDKQIAARLGITQATVNDHTRRLFQRFGVNSRTELMALWVRRRRNCSRPPWSEGD